MKEAEWIKQMTPALKDMEKLLEVWAKHEKPKIKPKAFPPASEADIAAAEALWNFKFPPSYRAFLKIHNGWMGNLRCNVFGVSGPGFEEPYKRWKKSVANGEKYLKRKKINIDKLRKDSIKDPELIYAPDHVPVLMSNDDAEDGVVFNRHRRRSGGEYDMVIVRFTEQADISYPNMARWINSHTLDIRGDLRDNHGIDPNTVCPYQKIK